MAADTPFAALLERMIGFINAKLTAEQRQKLASAMPQIQWDFPDAETKLCLAATAAELSVSEPLDTPPFLCEWLEPHWRTLPLEDDPWGRPSSPARFMSAA